MRACVTFFLSLFIQFVICRDFYIGMFKKNDFLVAQDRLYKERTPFRMTVAKYGRLFVCPITYIRVVDRLGVGRGPFVRIIRGGLLKKYVVLRITSPYNLPISVNIYIGCENKQKPKSRAVATTVGTNEGKDATDAGDAATNGPGGSNDTAPAAGGGNSTAAPPTAAG